MEESLPNSEECDVSAIPLLTFEIPPPPLGEPPPLSSDSGSENTREERNSFQSSPPNEMIPASDEAKLRVRTSAVEIMLFSGPVFAGVGMLVLSGTFLNKLWLDPSLAEGKGLLRLLGVELIVICFLVYAICHAVIKTTDGRVVITGVLLGLFYCLLVFLTIIWSIRNRPTAAVPTPLRFEPLSTGITLSAVVSLLALVVLYNWYRTRDIDSLWKSIRGVRALLIRSSSFKRKSSRAVHVIGIVYLIGGLLVTVRQDVVLDTETFGQNCHGFMMYSMLVALHGWLQVLAGRANCLSFNKSSLAYRLVLCTPIFTVLFLSTTEPLKTVVATVQALNLISIVVTWYCLMQDMNSVPDVDSGKTQLKC